MPGNRRLPAPHLRMESRLQNQTVSGALPFFPEYLLRTCSMAATFSSKQNSGSGAHIVDVLCLKDCLSADC
jgi:hypothetical protein